MATPTQTLQHTWVRHSIEAVDVIVDPVSGNPYVVSLPVPPIGTQTGCLICSEPLTTSTASTSCTGEDNT